MVQVHLDLDLVRSIIANRKSKDVLVGCHCRVALTKVTKGLLNLLELVLLVVVKTFKDSFFELILALYLSFLEFLLQDLLKVLLLECVPNLSLPLLLFLELLVLCPHLHLILLLLCLDV